MKLKHNKEEGNIPETVLANKLDIIKETNTIHHPLNHLLYSELVYSKPNEKEREFITEMVSVSEYTSHLNTRLQQTKKWTWNKQENQWELKELTKQEKEQIQHYKEGNTTTFMKRPWTIATLRINQKDNPHMDRMLGILEEPEIIEPEQQQQQTIMNKILDKFKGQKDE